MIKIIKNLNNTINCINQNLQDWNIIMTILKYENFNENANNLD